MSLKNQYNNEFKIKYLLRTGYVLVAGNFVFNSSPRRGYGMNKFTIQK